MMQVDVVRIASAGDTFSQALWLVRLCLFVVGTHLHLPVPMAVGPVSGPGHPSHPMAVVPMGGPGYHSCLHF